MRRGPAFSYWLGFCLILVLVLPAVAGARVAYFTGFEAGPYAAPVDLATGQLGAKTTIATEGAPEDVAISPDGSTAYVTGAADELVRIAVATNTAQSSIPMSGIPWDVAISPDGTRAYTANQFENSVTVLDLVAGTEVGAIPVGQEPAGIAVTPDGSRAYVTNALDDTVSVIDLATNSVTATIPVGGEPLGIAVTPDGKRVYVVNRTDATVSEIDVATNAVTKTIPTAVHGAEIAISPDGARAYVLSEGEGIAPIDLSTATAGTLVPLSPISEDIAIQPDGHKAFITHEEGLILEPAATAGSVNPQVRIVAGELLPFDLGTNTVGSGTELYERPLAVAIVPNQPPRAAFTVAPESPSVGSAVAFNGSGSSDADGTVARYDWEFGDGSTAANGGATPSHSYAKPGTYQVTLTVTDNEGCSTKLVFTGQTAYCNGSSVARVTHSVTVPAPPACPVLSADASSFHPKIRPGHVVPGVRIRLTSGAPANLSVSATLLYKDNGQSKSAALGKLSVKVEHWRRVRFPIPAALRDQLPLGTKVGVKLHIEASPLSGGTCGPTVTDRTIHVPIVKVFPNAVQRGRVF